MVSTKTIMFMQYHSNTFFMPQQDILSMIGDVNLCPAPMTSSEREMICLDKIGKNVNESR